MNQIGTQILGLCAEFQSQGYILITISCLIIGAVLALSEDGTEKLKKRGIWIVLGWIIFSGALTIGAQYGNQLKF